MYLVIWPCQALFVNVAVHTLLQKELDSCRKTFIKGEPPIQVVGEFLRGVFDVSRLPCRSALLPITVRRRASHSTSFDFIQVLHYCPNYSQCQLIQTIIGICSGVPEAFEIFHCQSSTTEEELSLFLERTVHHSLRSILLEVNRLPFKLQEVHVVNE